jgi:hypothetical protein
MTTDDNNTTETTEVTTTEPTDLNAASFSDYEKIRRGTFVTDGASKSAPEVKPSEQKKASASDAEHTEANENLESEEDSEDSSDDKPRKKGGFQKRIDKLTSRYSEEVQRREALEQRLAQLEAGKTAPKAEQVETKSVEGKPDPEKFDTHAEYVEALTDWKLEQREKAVQEKQQKEKLFTEQEKIVKSHSERVKSFAEKTEDFQEVIEAVDDVPLSSALQQMIVTSDKGPELMYELAKNREEYERIAKLSPIAAARELGKIEARIESKSSEAKPEPKKITKAPSPIAPIGGNSAGSIRKSITDPDLPFAEYEQMRRKQMSRR